MSVLRLTAALLAGLIAVNAVPFKTTPNKKAFETLEKRFSAQPDPSDGLADVLLSNFQDPPAQYRPRIRYWLPNGKADPDVVRSDLKQLAERGFGGAEFLDFQKNGKNDTDADPAIYGHLSSGVLNASIAFFEESVSIGDFYSDFAQTSIAGAATELPDANAYGSATELARGTILVTEGTIYNGPVPPPLNAPAANVTNSTLFAVVVAKTIGTATNASIGSTGVPEPIALDESSLKTLDASAGSNITFTASGGDYLLFAFWFRPTGEVAQGAGFQGVDPSNPDSFVTYSTDHYSHRGADVVIEMNKKYFQPSLEQYWQGSQGGYLWEDSVEVDTAEIWWTEDIAPRMEEFGLDIKPYLPLLYANASATAYSGPRYSAELPRTYTLNDTVLTQKIVNTYLQALTIGYQEYLSTLVDYAHSVGLKYSCQVGYNQPVDVTAAIAQVDLPEAESLSLDNDIGAYRWLSGGQHFSKKRQLSTEVGAVLDASYQLTWPVLLALFNQGYAGGINQAILHGFPYSGFVEGYPPFPGYEPFTYNFPEAHGPRQPAWNYDKIYIDHIARAQFLLALGEPCLDLGFYRLSYYNDRSVGLWPDEMTALTAAGYTFEPVSPSSFRLNDSYVYADHLSTTGGPGYAAFIIDDFENATIAGLQTILEWGQQGLPIVFGTQLPSVGTFYNESDSEIQALVAQITNLSTTAFADSTADLPSALQSVGVNPSAILLEENDLIFNFKRYDPETEADYYYVYNSSPNTTETAYLSFENHKLQPMFEMNAWTGEVKPVVQYAQVGDRANVNITLKAYDFRFFALSKNLPMDSPLITVVQPPAQNLAGYGYADGVLSAFLVSNGSASFDLSNGSSVDVEAAEIPAPITLSDWQVDVEAWAPIANTSTTTGHSTSLISLSLDSLLPWNNISQLYNVSGTATYTTSFGFNASFGATVNLTSCFHTCNISVNGHEAPYPNIFDAVIDISSLLVDGSNEIVVEVSTPLGNLLRVYGLQNYSTATVNFNTYPATFGEQAGYGLSSPVVVQPYQVVAIA